MMSRQRIKSYSVVVGAVSLALAAFTGCTENKPEARPASEKVSGVATMEVRKTTTPDTVDATGTIRAALSAQLAAQVMGTITRVNVNEGDRVRRGEVLVAIDGAQQQAAYSSARAGLVASQQSIAAADADYALAEATMKRYQTLYDKKSLSPQEYDEMKTKLAAAQARRDAAHAGATQAEAGVSQAGTAVSFTKVRAPFDGLVTSRLAEPGAMAAPGVPLIAMEDPSKFRLEAQVDESKIAAVKDGATVPVFVDALGDQVLSGKVVQIVPTADPGSRTFTVKIDLPSNPQIRSGMFGRVQFPKGEREVITVPKSAVLNRGQMQAVYVLGSDGAMNLRFITLGSARGNEVEVLSGVQSGDRIVTNPGDRDLSGKQVEGR